MRRRTRLTAGIFALVAMTFSLAETAWASACAPMEMNAVSSEAQGEVSAHESASDPLHQHEREDSGDGERRCPFSPAAAQACAGAASLPTHAVDGLAPAPERARAVFFDLTQQDTILQESLFRPPRA